MPAVPTFAELGYPEFTARIWFGLLVKRGTPADIIKRYTDAARVAHADPEVRSASSRRRVSRWWPKPGLQLLPNIKQQIERWGRLVTASGFSAEDRGSTR